MLYIDQQETFPPPVMDMPKRKLTGDDAAFVERVVSAVKNRDEAEVPPQGLSERELFAWRVAKDIQSPEGMAVLDAQIGQDLMRIARGEKVDITPPSTPSKRKGLLGLLQTCIFT